MAYIKKAKRQIYRCDKKKVRSKNILGAHQLLAFQDYLATAKVKDRDYSEWGIGDNSLSIEMRFRGVSETGTNYVDGVLLLIGNKSEDGDYYYA